MDKLFHQNAPLIVLDQMPPKFRSFFVCDGYSELNVAIDSDIPDLTDHDNILTNSEIHHGHSYKIIEVNSQKKWKDGDCLERLKGICSDFHDYVSEAWNVETPEISSIKWRMARYSLSKATHYATDCQTDPHNHVGKPWSTHHLKYEQFAAHWLMAHRALFLDLQFQPVPDVYKYFRNIAISQWDKGLEMVALLEQGKQIPDEIMIQRTRMILVSMGSLWLALAKEAEMI